MTLGGVREPSWSASQPRVLRRRGAAQTAPAGQEAARAHQVVAHTVALGVAVCCLGLGVLGFVAGPTTNSHLLMLGGRRSGAALFGLFQVSVLLNVLHAALGVIGVATARSPVGSRRFLRLGGLVFLALSGYGAIVVQGSAANVLPTNDADVWLHVGLAAVLLVAAVLDGMPGGHDRTARTTHGPCRPCRAARGRRRTPPSPPGRPRARVREVPLSRSVQCWSRTRPSRQRSKT